MRQKRMGIGAIKTSFGGVRPNDQKGTFVADSPDSGLVYPHKGGLPSHICNGNFGEVCRDRRLKLWGGGRSSLLEAPRCSDPIT
jgi:hypothetical protein